MGQFEKVEGFETEFSTLNVPRRLDSFEAKLTGLIEGLVALEVSIFGEEPVPACEGLTDSLSIKGGLHRIDEQLAAAKAILEHVQSAILR